MAVVSVSADNFRLEDAEAAGGYANIGGGPSGAAEGSFPYQGSNLFNRKVTSSSGAGFYYDPTTDGKSAQDMTTAARRTMIAKMIVTDYGGLQPTNGCRIQIGSGTSAYYVYQIAGTLAKIAALQKYPDKGGVVIVAIDPNIAGYRDGSGSGSPVLTAVDYFGCVAAFASSTAKSENVGLDAIDLGEGLTLVGGDGGDTDGDFTDFLDFDEGTIGNRFGFVTQVNGVLFCMGTLRIGNGITAAGFTDNATKVIFVDSLFNSGWSRVLVDLTSASSVVTLGNTIDSLGTDTVVDTRADLTVTGVLGTLAITGTIGNFRNAILNSRVTLTGELGVKDLTQGGATIDGARIRTNALSGVASINDFTAADVSNTEFVQAGAGHAIELVLPGTYNLDNLRFTGYGANGSNAAAIYNNSGGLATINISGGGDTPTVRDGAGVTTIINNTKSVTINNVPAGAEWRLYEDSGVNGELGTVELDGAESHVGGVITYAYNYTADDDLVLQVLAPGFEEYQNYFTISSADQTINVVLSPETNQ